MTPNRKFLLDLVKPIEHFNWKKHNLTVVGDGNLKDGKRIHLVNEILEKQPIELSNALIISVHDFNNKK